MTTHVKPGLHTEKGFKREKGEEEIDYREHVLDGRL